MNHRHLTLQPFYSPRKHGLRIVPELRLCGLWLERSGFRAGQRVRITVRTGTLTIKAL